MRATTSQHAGNTQHESKAHTDVCTFHERALASPLLLSAMLRLAHSAVGATSWHNASARHHSVQLSCKHVYQVCRGTPQTTQHALSNFTVVLVHQYSKMGGCGVLMAGLAEAFAAQGLPAVTFDCRGVGRSSGHSTFTGAKEVNDVVAVADWVAETQGRDVILVASSAGVVHGCCGFDPTEVDGCLYHSSLSVCHNVLLQMTNSLDRHAVLTAPRSATSASCINMRVHLLGCPRI